MFCVIGYCITENQKQQGLEGCHSDKLGGGHFGRDKTFSKVTERFYWVGIIEDVKEFCRTCDNCQKANRYVWDIRLFRYACDKLMIAACNYGNRGK